MAVKEREPRLPRTRLDFRTEPHIKEAVEQAASLLGQNVSDFVTGVLYPYAQNVIEQHRVIRLSREDSRRFLEALNADEPPNDALRRAAERYKAHQASKKSE